ncbi:MAG: hypothetical protein R2792_03820 [Saprospiraceae bacterium]
MPTDLTDWNTNPIYQNTVDLYTAVLHEGMHLLGIASTYGGAIVQGQGTLERFTDWDNFLYKKDGNNYIKFIEPANDPDCCSKQLKNPAAPGSFSDNCDQNIVFRQETLNWNLAEVSYSDLVAANGAVSDVNNWLSHLDIRCAPDLNDPQYQYVMHPGINACPNNYSYPRRDITAIESSILCRIGHAGPCTQCVVYAEDDYITQPIFLNSSPSNNPIRLKTGIPGSASDGIQGLSPWLIANDVYAPYSNQYSVELCGSDNEITVVPVYAANDPTKIVRFDVTGTVPGTFSFCYRLYSCDGTVCDEATVYITVLETPIQTLCSSDDCNLICFGDFEDFPIGGSNYYPSLSISPVVFTDITSLGNSPDIECQLNANPANKLARWVRSSNYDQDQESLRIPLSQPIYGGCTVFINYEATSTKFASTQIPTGGRIEIYGFTAAPCATIMNPPVWGSIGSSYTICPGVDIYCMDQNTNPGFDNLINSGSDCVDVSLQSHSFTYTHPIGAPPISELLVWGTADFINPISPFEGLVFFMDNISATSSCNAQVIITPTVVAGCVGGQAVVQYELCLIGQGTNPVDVDLQANIPQGMSIVPGGGFDANGVAHISILPGTECNGGINSAIITLTMDVSTNYSAGAEVPLTIDLLNTGLCLNQTADGGDILLLLEDCIQAPACVCTDPGSLILGNNPESVVSAELAGLETTYSNICIAVNGKLIIDQNMVFDKCELIMNQGAEIEVAEGVKLEIYNESFLHGCQHLWKGIHVLGDATLQMKNSTLSDAEYGTFLEDEATVNLENNTFDKNWISIYVPQSQDGQLQSIGFLKRGIFNNYFLCTQTLLPHYDANAPNQGTRSFAGIEINDVAGFLVHNLTHRLTTEWKISEMDSLLQIVIFYSQYDDKNHVDSSIAIPLNGTDLIGVCMPLDAMMPR